MILLLTCETVNRDKTEIRDRFPWAKLTNKTVVDVGGGSGHVAIYLATVSQFAVSASFMRTAVLT